MRCKIQDGSLAPYYYISNFSDARYSATIPLLFTIIENNVISGLFGQQSDSDWIHLKLTQSKSLLTGHKTWTGP